MKKYALISVYNKSNLNIICKYFEKFDINIISTGATASYIKQNGYKCQSIEEIIKFKEILGGRVKTLHPYIFASILFNRDKKEHLKQFKKFNFPIIDYIIVNLYPFSKTIINNNNFEECIEMIDIGGTALLRASAKNHNYVTTICNPNDYTSLINNIKSNSGSTNIKFRRSMAKKTFYLTSQYDKKIHDWLDGKNYRQDYIITNHKKIKLRYGENPHQNSYLLKKNNNSFYDNIIQGKELSFNNLKDIEVAYDCLNEFKVPTSIVIKHCSPCGASSATTLLKAFKNSIKTDPISSFGGIIALNRSVNDDIANLIIKNFYEIIIAPSFTKKSLKILNKKKNMRLIKTKKIKTECNKKEIFSINNGYLIQSKNNIIINQKNINLISKFKTTKKNIDDLIFALKICKYVKSNAIVLVKNQTTISIGGGQTSRIDSTKIALNKIKNNKKFFVAASDAFFPFIDNVELLHKNKCKAIIQPAGSLNDKKIIDYANRKKLPLYFINYRFFKH